MRIAAGEWAATLAPECGGAILSLTHAGRDVLRPAPAGATEPLDVACFPLVPYANRIADGRFVWAGEAFHLPPTHPVSAHPLHGLGWITPWQVAAAGPGEVTMRLDHAADAAWPWSFTAEQHVSLDGSGATLMLTIVSTDTRTMPVSLGFHPYFVREGARALRFAAGEMWLTDDALLPRTRVAADALGDWRADGVLMRDDLIDHCFIGWDGGARVVRDDGDLLVEAEGAPALHVYIPPDGAFFCVEPVTAMPDAVNHDAAEALQPGETRRVTMRIAAA